MKNQSEFREIRSAFCGTYKTFAAYFAYKHLRQSIIKLLPVLVGTLDEIKKLEYCLNHGWDSVDLGKKIASLRSSYFLAQAYVLFHEEKIKDGCDENISCYEAFQISVIRNRDITKFGLFCAFQKHVLPAAQTFLVEIGLYRRLAYDVFLNELLIHQELCPKALEMLAEDADRKLWRKYCGVFRVPWRIKTKRWFRRFCPG